MSQKFVYGGQAVIEGVLIVGGRGASLAVRRLDGRIWTGSLAMSPLVRGRLGRTPLVRGVVVLLGSLALGIKALNRSAEIAMAEPLRDGENADADVPAPGRAERGAILGSLVLAVLLGVGVFFLLPLLGARALDRVIASSLVSNLLEGLIRLTMLVAYIWLIGRLGDIKRVFGYHAAEHMTIHAHEHGEPLEADRIRRFPAAHPRCGTAFLITVVVVSILVFSLVGRPSLWLAAVSRVALLPAIAGISYELIRYSAAHAGNPIAKLLAMPGIAFQVMTTRPPDDGQIEVAVAAMTHALAADSLIQDDQHRPNGDASAPDPTGHRPDDPPSGGAP